MGKCQVAKAAGRMRPWGTQVNKKAPKWQVCEGRCDTEVQGVQAQESSSACVWAVPHGSFAATSCLTSATHPQVARRREGAEGHVADMNMQRCRVRECPATQGGGTLTSKAASYERTTSKNCKYNCYQILRNLGDPNQKIAINILYVMPKQSGSSVV